MLSRPLRIATFRNKSMHNSNCEQGTTIYLDTIASDATDCVNQSIIEAVAIFHDPQE